jgi:hypothetical protein
LGCRWFAEGAGLVLAGCASTAGARRSPGGIVAVGDREEWVSVRALVDEAIRDDWNFIAAALVDPGGL